jgi:hypothetical protein
MSTCEWLRRTGDRPKQLEPVTADGHADGAIPEDPLTVGTSQAQSGQTRSVEAHAQPAASEGKRHGRGRRIPVARLVECMAEIV